MSGSLTHSPADVIRQLLIDLGLGTDPSDSGSWPVFVSSEPDDPDSLIVVTDTEGRIQGRTHTDGEAQEHHGFQVRVRSVTHTAGYTKARAIAVALDQSVANTGVSISTSVYAVTAVTRVGDVISLGKNVPTSKHSLFTINALVALRQTT